MYEGDDEETTEEIDAGAAPAATFGAMSPPASLIGATISPITRPPQHYHKTQTRIFARSLLGEDSGAVSSPSDDYYQRLREIKAQEAEAKKTQAKERAGDEELGRND